MKKVFSRALAICVFATALASFCSAAESTESPSLAQGWRAATYQGLVAKLRPRNPNNMKFLFLGDPVPATMSDGLSGHGGFVRMKKHRFLWMHSSQTYFYLVNSDGVLCSLISLDSMSESTVSPRVVNVEMVEKEVWVPTRETRMEHVYNLEEDRWEWEEVVIDSGYWDTVLVREVYPILPRHELDRQYAFEKSNFKMLPLCQ